MSSEAKEKTLKFKAEVAQLLDIVIHSLYTDREIFVRELISNAADALEKVRYLSLVEKDIENADIPLEIRIETDDKAGTFTIRDTGIGMTGEEASHNLGTIAHSGSREFLNRIAEGKKIDAELIGQFGVGFYSAFMVADEVTVESRSANPDAVGVTWTSGGTGSYKIKETDGLARGTKITLKLKEEQKEYADPERLKGLIKRYSSFVAFPIFVNGEQVNTIQALWTKSPSEIKEDEYTEFYRFITAASDDPVYRLHFTADAPLSIRAILYVPGDNIERFGLGRLRPGVALYCRKVLIQQHVEELLPEYFRFISGVVDSEDLPLNISREKMQDSALINKLRRVLTGRLIKLLKEKSEKDPEKYAEFFGKFGIFLKEGTTSDMDNRSELAPLLRFASSDAEDNRLVSLNDYMGRMKEGQTAIYYISGPSRESIEAGPYVEAFKARGLEVLYCYEAIDDFVMSALHEFDGKKLVSADDAALELPEMETVEKEEGKLSDAEAADLARWLKDILGDRIENVRPSKRLISSPAVLVNPDSMMTTGMQRILQAAGKEAVSTSRMILEINPAHDVMRKLNVLRQDGKPSELARDVTELLLDNAVITAGLLIDPKLLVRRTSKLLARALESIQSMTKEE